MDAKTKNRLVNTLMTRFIQLYRNKYGIAPKFNRNTEKWGFGYMLEDLGPLTSATLEYYFTLRRTHSAYDLLQNYHEIVGWMDEDEKDEIQRRELREQTKQRVKEYEERWHQKL